MGRGRTAHTFLRTTVDDYLLGPGIPVMSRRNGFLFVTLGVGIQTRPVCAHA